MTEEENINVHPLAFDKGFLDRLNDTLYEKFDGIVQAGPFKGMKFENRIAWEDTYNTGAKLIGCYEIELHEPIKKAIERKPDTIINAGCAEGYYAVGLKLLLPSVQMFALDMNVRCLDQCERNGLMNNIEGMILIEGRVDAQNLALGTGHKLYVVDIEGHELTELDPFRCPDLLTADIIVECHDFLWFCNDHPIGRGVTNTLAQRFADTHDVEVIELQVPSLRDYPFLRDMPIGHALLSITEKRPVTTTWLACWARQRGESNG